MGRRQGEIMSRRSLASSVLPLGEPYQPPLSQPYNAGKPAVDRALRTGSNGCRDLQDGSFITGPADDLSGANPLGLSGLRADQEPQPMQKLQHQREERRGPSSQANNFWSSCELGWSLSAQQATVATGHDVPGCNAAGDVDGHPDFKDQKQRLLSSSTVAFPQGERSLPEKPPPLVHRAPEVNPRAPCTHAEQLRSSDKMRDFIPLAQPDAPPKEEPEVVERPREHVLQQRVGDGTTRSGSPARRKHPDGPLRYLDKKSWGEDAGAPETLEAMLREQDVGEYAPQRSLGDGTTSCGSPARRKHLDDRRRYLDVASFGWGENAVTSVPEDKPAQDEDKSETSGDSSQS